MIIVGVHGPMFVGKSTFARFLCDGFVQGEIIPFAKAVKDLAFTLGWNGKKDKKGRRFLQLLGTDLMRECIDKDYWIKKWVETAKKYYDPDIKGQCIIADDVRFKNEINVIKKSKGILVLIEGPCRGEEKGIEGHASEKPLPKKSFDFIVDNSTDLYHLRDQCEVVFKEIRRIDSERTEDTLFA